MLIGSVRKFVFFLMKLCSIIIYNADLNYVSSLEFGKACDGSKVVSMSLKSVSFSLLTSFFTYCFC